MAFSRWDDDEQLLADLADAVLEQEQPGADELRRAAEGALTWRTVDGELAAMAYDSLHDDGLLTRARSATARRTVVFEHAVLRIELELTPDGVVGQVMPPVAGRVELSNPGGLLDSADADDAGNFLFEMPITGPVRLRCRTALADVTTEWLGLTRF